MQADGLGLPCVEEVGEHRQRSERAGIGHEPANLRPRTRPTNLTARSTEDQCHTGAHDETWRV